MRDAWIILGLFGLLVALTIATGGKPLVNVTSNTASTTIAGENLATEPVETTISTTPNELSSPTPAPAPELTPAQIEQKVDQLNRERDKLEEELRKQELREPTSIYAGLIHLETGGARSTNVTQEYVRIRADNNNPKPINISNWYLESRVTYERAALPQGTRSLRTIFNKDTVDVLLAPGEYAYLLTSESPLQTSGFHENRCTGYLLATESFYPALSRSCPRPLDEMERFADIALDDDRCYDFVQKIQACEMPTEETVDEANLSGRCERFVENNLSYNACIQNHEDDPFFDDVGHWRLYLDRDEELWRQKREIIRLIDESDQIVDVVEY